jgi:hypothetical protein
VSQRNGGGFSGPAPHRSLVAQEMIPKPATRPHLRRRSVGRCFEFERKPCAQAQAMRSRELQVARKCFARAISGGGMAKRPAPCLSDQPKEYSP